MHNLGTETLANALDDLLDQHVGIIHSIKEDNSSHNISLFSYFNVQMCNTVAFCNQKNFNTSKGVAVSREHALAKAIGEGIERYCSAFYNKDKLPFCAYSEADFNCVKPINFLQYQSDLYKDNHFSWSEFTENIKVRWTPAVEATSNNTLCYVPAMYTYLPYIYGSSEKKIIQNISTGLACHSSYDLAAITAICEVVERDAFMIFWRNRLPPPKIKMDTLPIQIKTIIDEFLINHQEVTLFDITTDIRIPTVLAALRCKIPGNPSLIISGACKLTPEQAILSALEELELTRSYCLNLISDSSNMHDSITYDKIKTQDDHLRFWLNPANFYLADFLFESDKQVDLNEMISLKPNTCLEPIVEIFSNLGHKVFLADITTNDIKAYGLHVLRAIIPQLHPLAFGYRNIDFVCERLLTVPRYLGLETSHSQFESNHYPHPFP